MRVTHQPDGPGVPLGSTTVKPYRNEATVVIETTTLSERPDTWVTVCTGPSERPDTWVTVCTGHIGDTSSPRGGSDALEGVFGDG
jgi:hypothetical protein